MMAPIPGTPALARPCGCAGACEWAGRCGAGGGVDGPEPGSRLAVRATIAPLTPGTVLVARSAASRSGSSSCARAAGTVSEKYTFSSAMKISDTSPRSTMLLSRSGPLTDFSFARTSSLVTLTLHSTVCRFRPPPHNADGPAIKWREAEKTGLSPDPAGHAGQRWGQSPSASADAPHGGWPRRSDRCRGSPTSPPWFQGRPAQRRSEWQQGPFR
jgi:hypothetical protein